jgi:hypothetical protein
MRISMKMAALAGALILGVSSAATTAYACDMELNGCGPPAHLVPNATVLAPCPRGWTITPVRGFDYVTPAPGVTLHRGMQIHVNLNGTFDLVR